MVITKKTLPGTYDSRNNKEIVNEQEILGGRMSREAVLDLIRSDPKANMAFQALDSNVFKEDLIKFLMGEKGAKVSYDPVFKHIFNPEVNPERLSALLSALMGERVEVRRAIPNESSRLSEVGSLLIMDILVELESGELANVEMQRIGYAFPGQRGACYSSDLMMRQYSRVKADKGKKFVYQDLKRVYTIVLLEKSTSEFYQFPEHHIHRAEHVFDTGLKLELLQKFIFISLDIFHENVHNIKNKQDAWLYFLSSDDPIIISRLVKAYPEFWELYEDLGRFRTDPKELITMYSEALKILDYNTVQYMIEEQQKELEEQQKELEEQQKEFEEQQKELEAQQKAFAKMQKENFALLKKQEEKNLEIEQLKFKLEKLQNK